MKFVLFLVMVLFLWGGQRMVSYAEERIPLPAPRFDSDTSVEEALVQRRSRRSFALLPLSLEEVAQILWAACGVTDQSRGFRTAPSAGALYPLEVYLVVGNVESLLPGVYRYLPEAHALVRIFEGNKRRELFEVGLFQGSILEAPAVLVFTAVYERTTRKYGERGIRYVHMEVGHAAQNVYLQAEALQLGTVVIGAFQDEGVRKVLRLPSGEHPLYLMPVGKSRE
ncbi:MAG: SagB/ThcOx family dehydrogenase [Candidatus Caldatribacteriaceae bacterium]